MELRVATWNILADAYASPERYAYAGDARVLSWSKHRLRKIREILAACRADVLVLQEVDHPGALGEALSTLGYSTHFEKRNGGRQDGCIPGRPELSL